VTLKTELMMLNIQIYQHRNKLYGIIHRKGLLNMLNSDPKLLNGSVHVLL